DDDAAQLGRFAQGPAHAKRDEREAKNSEERGDRQALRAGIAVKERERPSDRGRERQRRPEERRLAPRQRRDALRYGRAAHEPSLDSKFAASLGRKRGAIQLSPELPS